MDTLFSVDPDHEGSFEHFVSLLGIEPRVAGTFRCLRQSRLAAAWEKWREIWFRPSLGPAFAAAYECGIRSHTRELQAIDRSLDSVLSSSLRQRSREAALPFFTGKSEMQGNREWLHYQKLVEEGESPGHLPVAFALQSALYHLALFPALSSYAWFEFRSREGNGIPAPETESELAIFASILPDVPVAVASERGDSFPGGSPLRIV